MNSTVDRQIPVVRFLQPTVAERRLLALTRFQSRFYYLEVHGLV